MRSPRPTLSPHVPALYRPYSEEMPLPPANRRRHPGQVYPRTVRAYRVGVLQCDVSRRRASQFCRGRMAKKPEDSKAAKMKRRQRVKVSAKEALKRMQAFGKRREKFI